MHTFLKSDNWDTRIAAGQAIEAIANNVPMWDPPGLQVKGQFRSTPFSLPLKHSKESIVRSFTGPVKHLQGRHQTVSIHNNEMSKQHLRCLVIMCGHNPYNVLKSIHGVQGPISFYVKLCLQIVVLVDY